MRLFPRAPSRHGTVRSLPLRSPSQRGAPICKMTCGFACLFRSKACHYAPFSGMTRPAIASNCGNPRQFLFAFCTDQGRLWRRVSPPSRKLNEFATSFIPSRSFERKAIPSAKLTGLTPMGVGYQAALGGLRTGFGGSGLCPPETPVSASRCADLGRVDEFGSDEIFWDSSAESGIIHRSPTNRRPGACRQRWMRKIGRTR